MGTQPADEPYMLTSQIMTSLFFGYYPLMLKKWDSWTE